MQEGGGEGWGEQLASVHAHEASVISWCLKLDNSLELVQGAWCSLE